MNRLFGAGLVSLSLSLPAQVPAAPTAEGKVVATPSAALAFFNVASLAQAWRRGMNEELRNPRGLQCYELRVAAQGEDGALGWTTADSMRFPQAARLLAYFVPREGGAGLPSFCVRSDGAWAMTENGADTASRGGREIEPMDVLGEGGKGTLFDFPRTPTRGRDGNLWLPGELVRTTTVRLQVVDETGAAMGGVWVETIPAEGEFALAAPIPAGQSRTLFEGDGTLVGLPASGLGLQVTIERTVMQVRSSAVQRTGATLRITVDRGSLSSARRRANESAAIATLKNICSAQAQCQASGVIDVNGNGAGEYGTFAELSGRVTLRGGDKAMSPPVLSSVFGNVKEGVVTRSGYCFRMFLPGKDAVAIGELAKGGPDEKAIDAGKAETMWCAYAWPLETGASGQRVFFVNQSGDVLACPNADGRYSGQDKRPEAKAAYQADGKGLMSEALAANTNGGDGQHWVVVN
jgi:hypothetical protein